MQYIYEIPTGSESTTAAEQENTLAYQKRLDAQLNQAIEAIRASVNKAKKDASWEKIPELICFQTDEEPLPETIMALKNAGWHQKGTDSYDRKKFVSGKMKGQISKTAGGNPLTPAADIQIPKSETFVAEVEEMNRVAYQMQVDDQLTKALELIQVAFSDAKSKISWNKVPGKIVFTLQDALPETIEALKNSGWKRGENNWDNNKFYSTDAPTSQTDKTKKGNPLTPTNGEIPNSNDFVQELQQLHVDAYQEFLDKQMDEARSLVPVAVENAKQGVRWNTIPAIRLKLSNNPLPETITVITKFGWEFDSNSNTFVKRTAAEKGEHLQATDGSMPDVNFSAEEITKIFEQLRSAKAAIIKVVTDAYLEEKGNELQDHIETFSMILSNLKSGLQDTFAGDMSDAKKFSRQMDEFMNAVKDAISSAEFELSTIPVGATIEALKEKGWVLKKGTQKTFINVMAF